jgi:hypothetical protein
MWAAGANSTQLYRSIKLNNPIDLSEILPSDLAHFEPGKVDCEPPRCDAIQA